jgi:hypothetical protein
VVENCAYCKYWKRKAFITVIPGVETELMGDRIVLQRCGRRPKVKKFLTPGNYYCKGFEERNNA